MTVPPLDPVSVTVKTASTVPESPSNTVASLMERPGIAVGVFVGVGVVVLVGV